MKSDFCVYVLTNAKGELYVGKTCDVNFRVVEHNSGDTPGTRAGRPWWLLYYLNCKGRSDATLLESYIHSIIRRSELCADSEGSLTLSHGYLDLLEAIKHRGVKGTS